MRRNDIGTVKVHLRKSLMTKGDELKSTVEEQIKEGSGAKMTGVERKELARVALDLIWRMGRGEFPG